MRHSRARRTPTLALGLLLLLAASPGLAFKGLEHRVLSRLALETALESMRPWLSAEEAEEIRTSLLDSCAEPFPGKGCFEFGLVTRSVDVVAHPDYLVHDRKSCAAAPEKQIHHAEIPRCRRTVKRCPDDAVPAEVRKYTERRIQSKARRLWNRLMAVHRNLDHFEACAVVNYDRLHRTAVEAARHGAGAEDWWTVPLLTEALALHYLQDAFPPGHFLTPRAHSLDLIARHLHNRLNKQGNWAEIDLEPLAELAPSLESVLESYAGPLPLTPGAVRLALACDAVEFHGDGALLRSKEDAEVQAVILILASARSIEEVLLAGIAPGSEPPPELELEFQGWQGDTVAGSERMDRDSLRRPGLELSSSAATLIRYPAGREADRLDRWSLSVELLGSRVADFGGTSGGRWEVSLIGGFPGDGDIEAGDGKSTNLRAPLSLLHGFATAGTFSYESWDGYETYGGQLIAYPVLGRFGPSHVNYYLGIGGGARRYFTEGFESDRFIWSLRTGIGLGLVYFDVAFEDGHRLAPTGRLESSHNLSVGFRAQLIF